MLHLSQKRTSSSPQLPESTANADPIITHRKASLDSDNMISTIIAHRISASAEPLARTKLVDVGEQADSMDSRSSSLSELDDNTEDRAEGNQKEGITINEMEADSEAETELLTPRKPNATNLDTNGAHQTVEKSPSKLTQEITTDILTIDRAEAAAEDALPPSSNLSTHTSSPSPSKDAHISNSTENIDLDTEQISRKRKRSTSLASSLSDLDEPLAKRSHSSKHELDVPTSHVEEPHAHTIDMREQTAQIEEDAPVEEDLIVNEIIVEDDATPIPVVAKRGGWSRRGKMRGKRGGRKPNHVSEGEAVGEPSDVVAEEETPAVDAEAEEEASSGDGELIAKKRSAMDAFSGIEKEFAAFRERHLNEQLGQVNRDLELLERNLHPIYLAQLKCIDDHRDQKVHVETVTLRYKRQALAIKTVAERTQLHSQFFQDIRKDKDDALEKCYKEMYALQKDRRRWGSDETNYNYLYNPKRSQQIQTQASYNLEVSILSGVAKHVGFPAAPDINGLPASEIEADFQAMTIPARPAQPRIYLRDAERTAAQNGFFEQNAWANPTVAHAMLQAHPNVNHFATPVQTRLTELPATNGSNNSNSTVVMSAATSAQAPHYAEETPNAKRLASLGNISKPPSRLQEGTERIHTTHSSSASAGRATPAQESSISLPIEAPVPAPVFSASALHGANEYGSGISQAPSALTAPVGAFPS